jgi:hypothetical protein
VYVLLFTDKPVKINFALFNRTINLINSKRFVTLSNKWTEKLELGMIGRKKVIYDLFE